MVFFSTTVMLFIQNQVQADEVRRVKNIEIAKYQKKFEDCQDSKFRLVEKYEILFYDTEVIKKEIKPIIHENATH